MIAKEGRIILIPLFLVTFTMGLYAHTVDSQPLTIAYGVLGILFLFSLNFFRDPQRTIPMDEKLIISPADGKVVKVTDINDPEVGESAKLVSIFLDVFNVHANRVPIDGTVSSVERKSGKFLAAFDHKASDENEQVVTVLDHHSGKYKIKQIAGLIARRILCYAEVGSKMHKGGRLGFIRFGSRTDLIMPNHVAVQVEVGQKVTGGETIIGKIS
ncbi:MAG: phosphatidylserine decarboxylase family protein [Candidatus Marinimicrobia bacterium]|jgi:phosphatidylserine decarboxylase|nr:phosphatidylserine decarboxylase family protein [Candidatus Neomarinimicrobiota bacterium]MBT3677068.1 phosphatidylserine decarboxylase family protein [Candidatus Neomarinimicrobiota bacterium]MBT3762377.1 phosphatidylserine decarboxylase family protein [Candidatus Neomarinimicrobiota bacterium]MBT4069477.1 phosphatidylserine decarboxylase family protein [Candidatus Neomarinimicrobiota bacterium]MBT4270507.1 phosphatidylserine decarboxylase family protein [Candidatus Neomarinimicrobiota bact